MKFATATGHDVSHFFVPVSLDQCDRHSSEIASVVKVLSVTVAVIACPVFLPWTRTRNCQSCSHGLRNLCREYIHACKLLLDAFNSEALQFQTHLHCLAATGQDKILELCVGQCRPRMILQISDSAIAP